MKPRFPSVAELLTNARRSLISATVEYLSDPDQTTRNRLRDCLRRVSQLEQISAAMKTRREHKCPNRQF